ncbi:MAG: amino acid permease [Luteitalea sp.]|nr:amino acid permease [Luteitalea sp.]
MRKTSTIETEKGEEFKRILSLWDLIWFGLAFIGPTAPYAMFGIATVKSEGHLPLVYLMAMVAMSFTAVSYGQMARAFPEAGSTYTYSSKALSPVIGFFAGWGMILDYILIPLLSVIFVSLTLNKILPQLPYFVWVLSSAAAITGINLRGIRVTSRANYVLNAIMGASLVWFILMAIRALLAGTGAGALLSFKPFYNPPTFDFNEVMGATSIAVLSYIGFDGVTTLSEDAKDPKRDIWRATVLVCFMAGGLFVLQSYLAQMVWPDYTTFEPVETAFMDIGRLVGGQSLFYFISFVLVVGGFASAITGQASASRLLAGMGRDRLLPYRIFGHIHPKLGTPVHSILLMGVLQLAGAVVLQFAEVAELVNFGAFIGFMLVNVSVISHYFFKLGNRGGTHIALHLLLPLSGFSVCLFIWIHLSAFTLKVGAAWMILGFLYLVYLTRGFTRRFADLKL